MRGLLVTGVLLAGLLAVEATVAYADDPDTSSGPTVTAPTPGDTPPSPTEPSSDSVPASGTATAPVASAPAPDPFGWLEKLDPRKWATDILDALFTTLGNSLMEGIRSFVDWGMGLGDSSLNFVTRTPPEGSYGSPTVRGLWDFSRALANAALAVIAMWGGFNVMAKAHGRSPYPDLMELLPRLILAALAANLTLEFSRLLIDVNNGIAAAVGQVSLPGYDQATPSQQGMALVFAALVYGIVALLLIFQMLMRLALLDVLIVLAPVAALLWVLPQTQSWTRWWADLFPVTVFQQAIQMIALRLGYALMTEFTPGSGENALLTLLLGIAVCWLTVKLPSLLRTRNSQASLFNLVSMVAVSRGMGVLGSASGSARSAGSGAAARPRAGV